MKSRSFSAVSRFGSILVHFLGVNPFRSSPWPKVESCSSDLWMDSRRLTNIQKASTKTHQNGSEHFAEGARTLLDTNSL